MRFDSRTLLLVSITLLGPDLLACGDKFLVATRGTRFQRGPEPGRGYAVLVYAPPTSPLSDQARKAATEKALTQAGYRPVAVGSVQELAENLRAGHRLVLAAPADASALEAQVGRDALVVLGPSASVDALLNAVDTAVRRTVRSGVAASVKP